jgi:putative transposase
MANTNDFRTGSHCVFHIYLVFVTKSRRGVLMDAAHETLRDIFTRVCQDFEAVLVDTRRG